MPKVVVFLAGRLLPELLLQGWTSRMHTFLACFSAMCRLSIHLGSPVQQGIGHGGGGGGGGHETCVGLEVLAGANARLAE